MIFQIQNEFGNSRDSSPIIKGRRASRFDQTVTYFTIYISLRIYPHSKFKGFVGRDGPCPWIYENLFSMHRSGHWKNLLIRKNILMS